MGVNNLQQADMLQKSQKDNVNQIAELRKQNDDVKRVLAEVMKEKNVARVLTVPEKSKVIHYMKREDGTMKKMEEDFVTFVARGQRPQKEFQYWKTRRKQVRKRRNENNQINPLFSLFPIFFTQLNNLSKFTKSRE